MVETLTKGSQGRLVVDAVSNIGPHYARTLREWRARFDAGFGEIETGASGAAESRRKLMAGQR